MGFTCFLKLPFELRQHVYRSYFSDLDLSGDFSVPPLFLCSRQTHEEAQQLFWQNARFNFRSTKTMVDFLTTIDQCTLTKLRHIAVRAFPFPCLLNEAHPWSYVTCSFHHVLPLFPGLQLSTLWVGDCFHVRGVGGDIWSYDVAYYIVDDFIESQGFRELIYVVDHDRFLKPVDNPDRGPASDSESEHWQTDTGGRDAQPSTWNTKIQERDGADCGASVTMFRVVDGNRRTAQEFETIQEASDDDQPCHRYDTGQIEIRIKRGKGADYVQKGEQGNKEANPLLKLFKEMTWKEIKEKDPYLDGENNPLSHL